MSSNSVFSKLGSSSLESVTELLSEVLVVTIDETLMYMPIAANDAVDIVLAREFRHQYVLYRIVSFAQ